MTVRSTLIQRKSFWCTVAISRQLWSYCDWIWILLFQITNNPTITVSALGLHLFFFFIPDDYRQVEWIVWLIFMFSVSMGCHVIFFLIRPTNLCHDAALSWAIGLLSLPWFPFAICSQFKLRKPLETWRSSCSVSCLLLFWFWQNRSSTPCSHRFLSLSIRHASQLESFNPVV